MRVPWGWVFDADASPLEGQKEVDDSVDDDTRLASHSAPRRYPQQAATADLTDDNSCHKEEVYR